MYPDRGLSMAKQRAEAPPPGGAEPAAPAQGQLVSTISRNVMAALGRPGDLVRVSVGQVTGDVYRVNVVTGEDVSSGRIAHSFFVTADEAGNITASATAIVK